MRKAKSIFISHFQTEFSKYGEVLLHALEATKYSEDGFGFNGVSIDGESISGVLINRTSTYIYEYEPSANEFVKKIIYLFHEIPFSIDYGNDMLYVFGTSAYLSQFKLVLKKIISFEHFLRPIELTPYKLYGILKKKKLNFLVEEIAIEKFNHKGVVGKFSGNVFQHNTVHDLVSKYQNDITKILFQIEISEEDSFGLLVSSNSSIKIISEAENFEYYFTFFKKLIL